MVPNLAKSTLVLIRDIISSDELSTSGMAAAAGCSERTIARIRSNLRLFGSVKAPPIKAGRPWSTTPIMLDTLCDHLLQKPDLYIHEMELFPFDEFDVYVPKSTISDTLYRIGIILYHLVYIDESGYDKRIGVRRTGWSPLDTTPVQVLRFYCDQRYQILPVYIQDGILLSYVFQGKPDASFFEDFIEELLHHYGKYLAPK
ncbi:hypothetical protein N7452_007961 [Penicillium brevicompactum]|uniref:Uncharacterized protein n=1 Tax=Penicillium brevicompactum TaxID=5074 RepID=A0A9W9QGG2_PENBR|nr:hypothetical protein N7452_007961 [Penicillium brevicompactum]